MSYHKEIRKVYYHILKGNHFIFADERNKKKLLDIVLEVQKKKDWMIYAFCLMDDSAYFVTEAGSAVSVRQTLGMAAERFLKECQQSTPGNGSKGWKLEENSEQELVSLQEIADRCREIHRLPLEEGVVRKIGDYWWSSYITYTGNYEWPLVDCNTIYRYFSPDPEKARRKLIRFHQ